MFGQLGIWELVVILAILLVIFGPSRLGDIGSSLGKGIRGFRKSLKEDERPGGEEPGLCRDKFVKPLKEDESAAPAGGESGADPKG